MISTFPTLLLRRCLTPLRVCETDQCVCERSKPALLKSVWKCELLEFDCLCRLAMRGLHYGQELASTNRPDTFAQTKPPTTRFCLQSGGGPYNFHGLLFTRQMLDESICSQPTQSAALATRCCCCISGANEYFGDLALIEVSIWSSTTQ